MTADPPPLPASDQVPIQVVDAGPPRPGPPPSDRELLSLLATDLVAARSAAGPDEVLVHLVDLATALVPADAVTVELRGPATAAVPWLLVHRGLEADEARALGDPAYRAVGPQRFGHRLTTDLAAATGSPGRLTLWRTERAFDDLDRERSTLAATAIEALVHQYLRRVKGGQRRSWWDTAEEFAFALVRPLPSGEVVQLVVDQVRDVSECDVAWLVTGDAESQVVRALSGVDVDLPGLRALDLRPSLSTRVIARGEQLRVTDLARDSHVPAEPCLPLFGRLGPALVQPVWVDGQCIGGLGMAWAADRSASYLSFDPVLPEHFAARVGLTMRVCQARADAERLAVLEERHRIRLDLHDRVVQRLYALGMALEVARVRDDRASVNQLLDHGVERVDETIAEIRRTISGLGVVDEGMDIYDAMVGIVDRLAVGAPFRPELRVTGLSRVPVSSSIVDDLFAVLEETLSNVVRHARASRCRATLDVDGRVELVVEDDGIGVPPGVVGSGLANMGARADVHGGSLTVESLCPGTRVTWSVPHPPEVRPEETSR